MSATDVLIIIAVTAFILIRRVRRIYVRRKLRLTVILPLFVLVACGAAWVVWTALRQPALAPYVGVGLAAGILMGFIAAGNAELHRGPDGMWHKANPWLGSLVLLVFGVFVFYRVWGLAHMPTAPGQPGLGGGRFAGQQTPVFVLLRMTVFAWFLAYFGRILYRWRRLGANEAV